MSVSFVHLADVHIGMSFAGASFAHETGELRRKEIKETFLRAIDYCEENLIDLLLIAGDLFNDDIVTVSDLKDIQRKFESLTETIVIIAAGNHDAIINGANSYRLLTWPDNVLVFDTKLSKVSIPETDVDVYGLSWDQKLIKEITYSDFKIDDETKTNLLVLHGDALNQSSYMPLKISKLLKKGYDYIALGHLHKPEIEQKDWAYPGSLEPLSFKETGSHGFILGQINGKDVITEFLPFSKREFILCEVELTDNLSFEEIKESVSKTVKSYGNKDALYRIKLVGMIDNQVEVNIDDVKQLVENEYFYCEIINETSSNLNIEYIKKTNQNNLIGEFILSMEKKGLDNPLVKNALNEGLKILLSERVN